MKNTSNLNSANRKATRSKALTEYRKKRNFRTTTEPSGTMRRKTKASAKIPHAKETAKETASFVIQEHHASHLHYDFRLEIDGVLKSWAVPKGMPTDKEDKRLAIQTEDHPLEYQYFSGVIPKGEYGAGKVKIWAHGTYENLSDMTMLEAWKKGHIKIALKGTRKAAGEYSLVKPTSSYFRAGKGAWLLIKAHKKG